MIERLIQTLQTLAAPADIQLARFASGTTPRELVLDFGDAYRLVCDCPQIQLDFAQRACLDRLDRFFEERSDSGAANFWTESVIRTGTDWMEVRELAATALSCLGH